jgi:hypothetical protein
MAAVFNLFTVTNPSPKTMKIGIIHFKKDIPFKINLTDLEVGILKGLGLTVVRNTTDTSNLTLYSDDPSTIDPNFDSTATVGKQNEIINAIQNMDSITGVGPITEPVRGFIVITSAAGNIDVTFADGSTLTGVPVALGLNRFNWSVKAVAASGTGGATIVASRGTK